MEFAGDGGVLVLGDPGLASFDKEHVRSSFKCEVVNRPNGFVSVLEWPGRLYAASCFAELDALDFQLDAIERQCSF